MTGYYVLAAISVVWALVLTGIGLTRPNFPPTGGLARALMGFGVILALATMGVLIASTQVEHPREEAAEAAEHKGAAEEQKGERAPAPGGPESAVKRVPVTEKEFSIQIQGGTDLEPASYEFAVDNAGKIPHDLAVEGNGIEKKTPLLDPGKEGGLKVALKPGKYRFYCTVPGHAQSGMDDEVTVK
jgi:plastocyanin